MSVFDKLLDTIKLNDDDYDEDGYLDEDLMDDDEEGDFFDDDPMDDKPKKKFFEKFGRKKEDDFADEEETFKEEPIHTAAAPKPTAAKAPVKQPAEKQRPAASSKITPMRSSRRANQASSMEVCVIKPTSVEDSREITETLLSGRTVILNLEGLDLEIAQRIIDFTSGATFAISGNLQKISNYIFLVTPTNVDISGDLQDLLNTSLDSSSMRSRF